MSKLTSKIPSLFLVIFNWAIFKSSETEVNSFSSLRLILVSIKKRVRVETV